MLAGSLAFALMGALAHAVAQSCPWQIVALSRCLLVFVMVGAMAALGGVHLVLWRPRTLWLRSFAGSLSLVGTFYALARLQVSTVLTLTNMFPIWVALLSWPMLGIVPSVRVWLAVLAGVAGVYLLQHPQSDGPQLAVLIALSCSLSTAVAMLGLHRLKSVEPQAVVVHFAGVATLFCIASFALFPLEAGSVTDWRGNTWALLIGVGVTASIGQLFLTKAFAEGDPAKVSVVSLTQAVFALVFDLFLDYSLEWRTLAGIALIIGPTAWVMLRES
jgi:drug/metabolite transporter (DMT)-like permease